MSELPIELYKGDLEIGDLKVKCAVLNNGQRIFSQRSFAEYIGYRGSGKWFQDKREGKKVVPEFIAHPKLEPYISTELREMVFVSYIDSAGNVREGIDASYIPDICSVWVAALQAGILDEKQQQIAFSCQNLVSAFAKIGIIALVDEVTGYQYDREKDELQKILKAYISAELLPWQKRFPDAYYKELFRLNGRDFTVNGIRKRPGVIGKRTNTLVYNELPKGVIEELRKNTPKNSKGKYKAKLHQSLTTDVGEPHLQGQLSEVITLFRLSDNMGEVWQSFERLKQRKAGQFPLPFEFDSKGHTIEPIDTKQLSSFDKNLKKGLEFSSKI